MPNEPKEKGRTLEDYIEERKTRDPIFKKEYERAEEKCTCQYEECHGLTCPLCIISPKDMK